MFKTALVIDDSRLARLTLKRLLTSQYGIKVFEAEGVLDAEHWVTQNVEPELIFMDVMMPEIDGFEGLARMRKNPSTTHIPVVMYSGDISEEARKKARDSGANGYLPKPVDAHRLEHLLNALSASVAESSRELAAAKAAKDAAEKEREREIEKQINDGYTAVQNNKEAEAKHIEAMRKRAQEQQEHPIEVPTFDEDAEPSIVSGANTLPPTNEPVVLIRDVHKVPPEITDRLSKLEEKLASQRQDEGLNRELLADVERNRKNLNRLERQTAGAEQKSKAAFVFAVFAILIALIAMVLVRILK